jgi:ADYC domain
MQGEDIQGTGLQGGGAARAYRGLGDLNGARFAIAADADADAGVGEAIALRDGQLTAPGFAGTEAFRGAPITATTADGRTFRVDVAAVTVDGRTRRTELLVDGLPVCEPGQHGVLVSGSWDARGHHVDEAGAITYSCMGGVIAKCVAWGYAPWLTSAADHATCTRLARADYCGDGISWTMDGTLIDVYDQLGVQSPASDAAMEFEAAWGPDGALCVARPRYQIEDASGRTLQPSCFASLPACHSLEEAAALGAVLANHSVVTPIEACE